jgi:predicted nucleic-acid-binding Zn-ribbon protein
MIILTTFLKNIQEYEKLEKANIFPVQYGCKNCGYTERLHPKAFITATLLLDILSIGLLLLGLSVPPVNEPPLCYQVS